jgi:hypothetical protein
MKLALATRWACAPMRDQIGLAAVLGKHRYVAAPRVLQAFVRLAST